MVEIKRKPTRSMRLHCIEMVVQSKLNSLSKTLNKEIWINYVNNTVYISPTEGRGISRKIISNYDIDTNELAEWFVEIADYLKEQDNKIIN